MKRELKRERTKRLLLDVTKALIQEKGCSAITLNEIMQRSGLSKGAIFHYVRSKDELFSWVLEERLEEINRRFFSAALRQEKTFEGPMQEITVRLPELEDPDEVSNRVWIYLLGKSDQPDVRQVIQRFYKQALNVSKWWIVAGQEAGVIPLSVDAGKTAELFMLISFGLRVRGALLLRDFSFNADDFAALMTNMLQSREQERQEG